MTTPDYTAHNFVDGSGGNTPITAAILNDDEAGIVALHRLVLGVFTTAGRPSAATTGAGASYYDSTLSKPAWSDGTVWRDASGTTV